MKLEWERDLGSVECVGARATVVVDLRSSVVVVTPRVWLVVVVDCPDKP